MEPNEDIVERVLLAKERTSLANERNKLANERTFLAWLRTGLASVGGGVAIIRLLPFQNSKNQFIAEILGSILVILGITIFFMSFLDYRTNFRITTKHGFASSIWFTSVIMFVLEIISIFLLLVALNKL